MSRKRERGQSGPLGVALLLGLTILGTTAVVAFGSMALTDTQDQSNIARGQHSMTLFDSQTAQVALGDSSIQTVDFGHGEGTYSVNPDAGQISIIQLDCDDNGVNDDGNNTVGNNDTALLSDDDDAYILNSINLGEVTYETGDKTLAYQGGGVWSKGNSAGSAMVSPPEFHYRGSTLTFPVVLTRGSGSVSGDATATITSPTDAVQVFSNSTESFPSRCGGKPFENPLTDGEVIVRVQSDYYKAWGRYFDTRTQGAVTYDHANNRVEVNLVSFGQVGNFGMPGDGGSIPVSGASGGHGMKDFVVELRPDDSDSATFNNLQWSMYVEEGDQRLEVHLKKSGNSGCSDGSTNISANLDIYYSEDGGETYQGWHKSDAFDAQCANLNGDSDDEIYLIADFVDDENGIDGYEDVDNTTDSGVIHGDPNLTYVDDSDMNSLVYFNIKGSDTRKDTLNITDHKEDVTWESKNYTIGNNDTETVDRLVNHYFARFPDEFDLTVDDKGSNTVNEGSSQGKLYTNGDGRYVTYLHVTKNEVEVDI